MRYCIKLIIISFLLSGCKTLPWFSDSEIKGSPLKVLDVTLTGGLISSSEKNEGELLANVRMQLLYIQGALKKYNAVLDLNDVHITMNQPTENRSTSFSDPVRSYAARFRLSLEQGVAFPNIVDVVLPLGFDDQGISDFQRIYGKDCSTGSSTYHSDSRFWYIYDASLSACEIRRGKYEKSVAYKASLQINDFKQTNKQNAAFPEYSKISDEEIKIVSFITHYGPSWPAEESRSAQYMSHINAILTNALHVENTNINADDPRISANLDFFEATYRISASKKLNVKIIRLNENFETLSALVLKPYRKAAENADIVLWNGHQSVREEFRKRLYLGSPSKTRYQINYIFGVDEFAHVPKDLARKSIKSDEETDFYKYRDFIVGAGQRVSDFDPNVLIFFVNMILHQKNYGYLFSQFSKDIFVETEAVIGNRFPEEFDDGWFNSITDSISNSFGF